MMEDYLNIVYRPRMSIFKHDGELLGGPFSIKEGDDDLPTPISRPKLIRALFDYTASLGIPVTFKQRVIDYGEDLTTQKAWAVTDQSERFEADLVIAADGVGSLSWKSVLAEATEIRSSGYAVYRVAYPTARAYEDPLVAKAFALPDCGEDLCHLYLGKNTHGIALVSSDVTTWMLTHKACDY